jgi:AAA+ superfamily predicted ATPase
LPDEISRKEIFRRYAKHLSDEELLNLSTKTEKMSGRVIYEVCKDSERRWASKRIRGETEEILPDLDQYLHSIEHRFASI